MQIEAFSELFPLFNGVNQETLSWLLERIDEHEYPSSRAVLMEDAWGNAVYFIVSGWVKVRRLAGEKATTLAVLGPGDFFGEMAILDESPRSTDVIALAPVELMSVTAQRFIQTLFKDPQLHHRLLQTMVRRLRQMNARLQISNEPPHVKLAYTLLDLSDRYGPGDEEERKIFNFAYEDLADVSNIKLEEVNKLMDKMKEKGWIENDPSGQFMRLVNWKQIRHLAGRA
jgi:CRP-like cAMP-binding protein